MWTVEPRELQNWSDQFSGLMALYQALASCNVSNFLARLLRFCCVVLGSSDVCFCQQQVGKASLLHLSSLDNGREDLHSDLQCIEQEVKPSSTKTNQ